MIVIPFWFLFKKAGFEPILSLLMAVPIVNLILLYVLAYRSWKDMSSEIFSKSAPSA